MFRLVHTQWSFSNSAEAVTAVLLTAAIVLAILA